MTDDLRRENAELRATIERVRAVLNWETGATSEYDAFYEVARIVDAAPAAPAVVSTVEELDALPFLSLVREIFGPSPVAGCDYGGVWERRTSGWEQIAGINRGETTPKFPARVLWLPSDTEGAGS